MERACVLDLKDGQSVLVEPPSALAKREAQKALKLQMQEEKLLETQKRRQKERLELEKKLEAEQRQQAIAGQQPGSSAPGNWSVTYTTRTTREMDTDMRVEDAELAKARYDSNVAGLDSMFEQAMAMKNKKL